MRRRDAFVAAHRRASANSVIVEDTPGGFTALGNTYTYGYEAINAAIASLTSGVVKVKAGTYDVGRRQLLAGDGAWVSAHASTTVTNGVAGQEDAYASEISVASDPGDGTLVAYMDFPAPVSRNDIMQMGFWALPNQVFSDRGMNNNINGGPFEIVLDEQTGAGSPQFTQELVHPEWVTDEWKFYTISNGIGVGNRLPSNLGTVNSIGIVWRDKYAGEATVPPFPHAITIDDIYGTVEDSWISTKSNVKLIGDGVNYTTLRAGVGLNFPMIEMSGSFGEIAHMEIDGRFEDQQAIDYAPHILIGSTNADHKLHHLYAHHARGAGIMIRGDRIDIYENLIEWTENAQLNVTSTSDAMHAYRNTLRYGTNDGNVWLFGGTNAVVEYNDLYDVTQEAINADPRPMILVAADYVPFTAKDGASGWTFQFNRIHGGEYGMQLTHLNTVGTVENNVVDGATKQGIVMFGTDIDGVSLLRNVVENCGNNGIQTNGANHVVTENWTRNNSFGMDLSRATGQTGSGNYAPDGSITEGSVTFAGSAPTIDESFAAGRSW